MAKSIMIQGTMSNAGKSLITAGLCRIFARRGYKVAPFKSQNMALNSYITEEGLEMGRAQVMQAEAAGVAPKVAMNPILLKPTNDTGSQVIVNGTSIGTMAAKDYFKYKKELIPEILKAYQTLEEEFDIIVIEGAGSPAEINLKEQDIVNMGLAKLVDAPVLLVGDIDRGGVFAQLVGTVMLLEEEEKNRIHGLIVNKFRGDKSILDPAIPILEEKTAKEVVGVVPYMHLDIEDEDSLSTRLEAKGKGGWFDIAVIRLPRISNFTDLNVLENIEGVSLRYVSNARELRNPDMIILPGTKNTMEDLLWLRQNGLEALIQRKAATGIIVFGICGGYQMMGEKLSDPLGVEAGGFTRGMGLLPMETVFKEEKIRTRVKGTFQNPTGILSHLHGVSLEGYEIHMGTSKATRKLSPLVKLQDESTGEEKFDGISFGNCYGTYVHGIFDLPEVAKALLEAFGKEKGLDMDEVLSIDYKAHKERQYDLLAEGLEKSLDIDKIMGIMNTYQQHFKGEKHADRS